MTPPTKPLGQMEFIALMAMVAATVAFSLDAMLPSLPEIGAELSPDNLNAAQLIFTSFVFGMGLGTFVTGPLSDAYGRKPVMLGGAVIYSFAAVWAYLAASLEAVLLARMVQGVGAAGPRVVALAMIRDLYSGREMAKILSFVMLVFSLVPALAPTLGFYIMSGFGWRSIFLTFLLFALATSIWLYWRQPETLAATARRPLQMAALWIATKEVFANPTTRLSILIQTLTFGMLFTLLSSTQPVFDQTFGRGDSFHLWYGGIAVFAASASIVNAYFVVRVGMRAIIRTTFSVQIGLSSVMILAAFVGDNAGWVFAVYIIWTAGTFYQGGLCIGNVNALGMEPMGHIAGLAASVMAAIATVGAVVIAVPIGLAFDGTPIPMAMGVLFCASLSLWLTLKLKRPGEV